MALRRNRRRRSRISCSMVAWLTEDDRPMARPTPNFVVLDGSLPDVGRLVAAMLRARQAVESRSWSHPQEPTTEEWWADVLADPRAQTRKRRGSEQAVSRTFYDGVGVKKPRWGERGF